MIAMVTPGAAINRAASRAGCQATILREYHRAIFECNQIKAEYAKLAGRRERVEAYMDRLRDAMDSERCGLKGCACRGEVPGNG